MIHSILQRALLNAAESLALEVATDMSCCGGDNYGMGCNCGGDYPTLLSGLQGVFGLGALGGTQDIWKGDSYYGIVNIGPQYAEAGTGALVEIIRSGLEDYGASYNTSVMYSNGTINPWFFIRGNTNIEASSPDDLQNQFVAAINEALRAADFQSAQVLNFAWKQLDTHNTDAGGNNPPYVTPINPGTAGTPPPTGNMTLQQWQAYCQQQGLTYDSRTGGCVCGTIDQWMVDAGLKKTCGESVLGFKSGAALAIVGIGAILLLPKILKNF